MIQLNETTDNALDALILDAMAALRGQNSFATRPLAPFLTCRSCVAQRVVAVRMQGTCEFSKHVMLGACVFHACGVKLPPDRRDVDKIGNHLDVCSDGGMLM